MVATWNADEWYSQLSILESRWRQHLIHCCLQALRHDSFAELVLLHLMFVAVAVHTSKVQRSRLTSAAAGETVVLANLRGNSGDLPRAT